MNCHTCGTPALPAARYCHNCGRRHPWTVTESRSAAKETLRAARQVQDDAHRMGSAVWAGTRTVARDFDLVVHGVASDTRRALLGARSRLRELRARRG